LIRSRRSGNADGFEAEPDDGDIEHREGQFQQLAFADEHSDDHGDAGGGDAEEEHLVPLVAQILVVDGGENDRADRAHRAGFRRRRRPSIMVPSTTKISTAEGMMPIRHLRQSGPARQRPRVLRHGRDVMGQEDAEKNV
jgi:hypothetical protein